MKAMKLTVAAALAALVIAIAGSAGEAQKAAPSRAGLDPAAVKAIDEMGSDLEKLNESHRRLMESVGDLADLYGKLDRKVQEVSKLAPAAEKAKGASLVRLFAATREMQEMQMSFNLQYLMLQNKISQENRQFSMVSNIMKNKHDTAKNSINNIR
jgi:predicted  nucleic acid-binding Zn-ribbon protein